MKLPHLLWTLTALAGLTMAITQQSVASPVIGNQTIFVEGSSRSCVIPTTHTVSIQITSIRIPTDAPWPGWLKRVKTFGVKADLIVQGPTGTSRRASFPLGTMVHALSYSGSGSILRATIDIPLLSRFRLLKGGQPYAHITIPVSLVKTDNSIQLSKLMQGLTDVTNAIAVPADLFSPGVQAFSTFVNQMFQADGNRKTVYGEAQLGFEIADSFSVCRTNQQALRAGALAEIFSAPPSWAHNPRVTGVIDINNSDDYCYYRTFNSDPNIHFSKKNGSSCPANMPQGAKTLNNPQIIFVVNQYPIPIPAKSAKVQVQSSQGFTRISKGQFSTFASKPENRAFFANHATAEDAYVRLQSILKEASVASSPLVTTLGKKPTTVGFYTPLLLKPKEQTAYALYIALKNCKLAGLDADQCN